MAEQTTYSDEDGNTYQCTKSNSEHRPVTGAIKVVTTRTMIVNGQVEGLWPVDGRPGWFVSNASQISVRED